MKKDMIGVPDFSDRCLTSWTMHASGLHEDQRKSIYDRFEPGSNIKVHQNYTTTHMVITLFINLFYSYIYDADHHGQLHGQKVTW
jgi:hypothetical protein